jgi:hypothetical protein
MSSFTSPTSSSSLNSGEDKSNGKSDNIFNDSIFKKNPILQAGSSNNHNSTAGASNGATSMRRLSSSNAFCEINPTLSKLSRMANIHSAASSSRQQHPGQTACSLNSAGTSVSGVGEYSSQASAFIITPNNRVEGYLLYLRIPPVCEPCEVAENFNWNGPVVNLFASMPVRYALYASLSQNKSGKSTATDFRPDHDDESKTTRPRKPQLILVTPKQSILQVNSGSFVSQV